MMVGREVNLVVRKKPAQPKEAALEVKNLYVRDERKNMVVNGVSFDCPQRRSAGRRRRAGQRTDRIGLCADRTSAR